MANYAIYCSDPVITYNSLEYQQNIFKNTTRHTDITEFFVNPQMEIDEILPIHLPYSETNSDSETKDDSTDDEEN